MSTPFAFSPNIEDTAQVATGVTRDGLTQLRRYWPADNARAAVLIVHGIAEHCGRYEHVARQLNANGISVVGYDQRGHGASGGRRGHVDHMSQMHDDVEDQLAAIRELGLPTALLGHSMGGLIVASYCLTDRPKPDAVVLSAPALSIDAKKAVQGPLLAISKLTTKPSMKLGLALEDLSSDPLVGETYAADPLVGDKASLGLLGAMVETTRSVAANLDSWSLDTLVIHGAEDKLVLPTASEPIGQQVQVKRTLYANGRHELFNEPWGPSVVDDVVAWLDTALA